MLLNRHVWVSDTAKHMQQLLRLTHGMVLVLTAFLMASGRWGSTARNGSWCSQQWCIVVVRGAGQTAWDHKVLVCVRTCRAGQEGLVAPCCAQCGCELGRTVSACMLAHDMMSAGMMVVPETHAADGGRPAVPVCSCAHRCLAACEVGPVKCDCTQGLIELFGQGISRHWARRAQHTRSLSSNLRRGAEGRGGRTAVRPWQGVRGERRSNVVSWALLQMLLQLSQKLHCRPTMHAPGKRRTCCQRLLLPGVH
jgi:hypothetical protein